MGLSSRLIKGASIDKRILVNNNPVKMNYVLKENDEICDKSSQEGKSKYYS